MRRSLPRQPTTTLHLNAGCQSQNSREWREGNVRTRGESTTSRISEHFIFIITIREVNSFAGGLVWSWREDVRSPPCRRRY